jgi:hypothetical protein
MNDESNENKEILDEITTTIDQSQTINIIDYFMISEDKASKYESYIEKAEKSKSVAVLVFIIGYIAVAVLAETGGTRNSTIGQFVVGAATISLILLGVYWYICWKEVNSLDINGEKVFYHRISRAIKAYKNGNIEPSINEFSSAMDRIVIHDDSPFSPEVNKKLSDYHADMEEKSDEQGFFAKTFPGAANKISHNMMNIKESDINYSVETDTLLKKQNKTSILSPIISYGKRLKRNEIAVSAISFFLIISVLVLAFSVDQEFAGILTAAIFGSLQVYYTKFES